MHWQGAWVHRQFSRSLLNRKSVGADNNLDKIPWPERNEAGAELDEGSPVEGPRGRRHMTV